MPTVKLTMKTDDEMAEPMDMAQPLGKLGMARMLDIKNITLVFEMEEAEDLECKLDELLSDRPYSISADIETKNKRTVNRRSASPAPSPMDRAGWN
jgi:hypothetical protein